MPYIAQTQRLSIDPLVEQLAGVIKEFGPDNLDGAFNYTVTTLLKHLYINDGEKYSKYGRALGGLFCVALELYRRKISKYEDIKIGENGDVYDTLDVYIDGPDDNLDEMIYFESPD